jgi:hypothetical protein
MTHSPEFGDFLMALIVVVLMAAIAGPALAPFQKPHNAGSRPEAQFFNTLLKVLVLQRDDLLGAELPGAGGLACGRLFGFGGFRR